MEIHMTMTSDVSPAVSGGEPAARVLRRRLLSDESIDALLADLDAGGLTLTGRGGFLPELLKAVLERGMQVELADHLGYQKGEAAGRGAPNPRNGATPKTVATEVGDVALDTPRDRAGTFTPALVPKGARRLGGLDEMIISLYAGGMTVRDIEHHLLIICPHAGHRDRTGHHLQDHRRGVGGGEGLAAPAAGPGLPGGVLRRAGGQGPQRQRGEQQGRAHRGRRRHRRRQARARDLGAVRRGRHVLGAGVRRAGQPRRAGHPDRLLRRADRAARGDRGDLQISCRPPSCRPAWCT
jgi:hypothetical protein